MTIDQLMSVCPPPDTRSMEHPWDEIARDIERSLPKDYIELCNIYGCGTFDDFIFVFYPFIPDNNINLKRQVHTRLEAIHQLDTMYGVP